MIVKDEFTEDGSYDLERIPKKKSSPATEFEGEIYTPPLSESESSQKSTVKLNRKQRRMMNSKKYQKKQKKGSQSGNT